jgi:undecaprenyl-diphosphatase
MWSQRADSRRALVLGLAGAASVVVLAGLVGAGLTDWFDDPILAAIRAAAVRDLFSPLRLVSELGSTSAVSVLALVVLVIGTAMGRWRDGLAGALTIALASIGNSALKLTIARARPDLLDPVVVEHGFGFPSGHSTLSMVAYGVLAVLVSRSRAPASVRFAILVTLGVLVGLIGASRVWLGVHFPTDVLAGWITGGVVVLVYATLTRRAWPGRGGGVAAEDPAAPRSDPPAPG